MKAVAGDHDRARALDQNEWCPGCRELLARPVLGALAIVAGVQRGRSREQAISAFARSA